jgi:hypothetical protein
MSRIKIFLVLLFIVALVGGLYVWQYLASLHQVSLTVTHGMRVDIYQVVNGNNQKSFTTVSDSVKIPLQNGDYCAAPNDTKYNQTPICFTVSGKDIVVDVEPNYSATYLSSQLTNQLATINSVITTTYSDIIDGFTLTTGALYGHGEWYGGTLTQKTESASDQGDVYRVLLKKVSGTWTVVAYPQIVLSKYTYPDVPYAVLDAVNRLPGVQN